MEPQLFTTQIASAAACAYILAFLKKSERVTWITEHTKIINAAFRLMLSAAATLGIHHAWAAGADNSHVLTVVIPSAVDLLHGAWQWFGQYAIQHGFGQLLMIGPKPPAQA